MIQNQSQVTKTQLNSNFSSFCSPSWCFPKATLLNYMCIVTRHLDRSRSHVKTPPLVGLVDKIDLAMKTHSMCVSYLWNEWTTRNASLMLKKVGRNETRKNVWPLIWKDEAKGFEELGKSDHCYAGQMGISWAWASVVESMESFLPSEDQGFQLEQDRQLGQGMTSGQLAMLWWHPWYWIWWETSH